MSIDVENSTAHVEHNDDGSHTVVVKLRCHFPDFDQAVQTRKQRQTPQVMREWLRGGIKMLKDGLFQMRADRAIFDIAVSSAALGQVSEAKNVKTLVG